MTRPALSRILALLLGVALAQMPATASACAACMGDVNSRSAGAINGAVFLLLGCIGGVLALLVAFGLVLMKRAAAPLPPHSEFSPHDSDPGAQS